MKQTEIDFGRGEQLWMLGNAQLPKSVRVESALGGTASSMAMKSVLRVIDDHARQHGEASLRFTTIAAEMGCHETTAKRAVEALQQLSLITCETKCTPRSVRVCNHYRIVWSELALRCQTKKQSTTAADQSTIRQEQSTTVVLCAGGRETTKVPQRADQSTTMEGATGSAGNDPPPPPLTIALPQTTLTPEWERVAGVADEMGVSRVEEAILAAMANGCEPEDVLRIIRRWRDSPDRARWESPGGMLATWLADPEKARWARRQREAAAQPPSELTPPATTMVDARPQLADCSELERLSRDELAVLAEPLRGGPYWPLVTSIVRSGDPRASPLGADRLLRLLRERRRE